LNRTEGEILDSEKNFPKSERFRVEEISLELYLQKILRRKNPFTSFSFLSYKIYFTGLLQPVLQVHQIICDKLSLGITKIELQSKDVKSVKVAAPCFKVF